MIHDQGINPYIFKVIVKDDLVESVVILIDIPGFLFELHGRSLNPYHRFSFGIYGVIQRQIVLVCIVFSARELRPDKKGVF